MLGLVNPRNYVKGWKVIWIYLWWQGQIRCAQDLAEQMREMRAAEKRWEQQVFMLSLLLHLSAILCYLHLLHSFIFLLELCRS